MNQIQDNALRGVAGAAIQFGTGIGSYTTTAVEQPPNVLEQHEKMLSALVNELGDICGRAACLADRLFGPSPEAVGTNEKQPANPPAIRRLEDLVSAAHVRTAALRGYLNRLERL